MKLRKTIQNQVYETLDKTFFTSDDFNVTFGETEEIETLLNITFKHNEAYEFDVFFSDNVYDLRVKPGEISESDHVQLSNFEGIIAEIPLWVVEVRKELKANNTKQIDATVLRELIETNLYIGPDDGEFTVAEINNLQQKFDLLEKRVVELEKDNIITKTQLEDLTKGTRQLSTDVEYYPKSTWLKTAPNKLVKLVINIGKSPEGRKILADGARKLLGLE